MSTEIDILHRDSELLVVCKPAGLLTHRSAMASESDVAMTRARDAIGAHVWPLHRLDRGTSGVLAFALSAEAARTWAGAFERGEVEKVYLAIVRGEPPEEVVVDYAVPKGENRERVPAVTAFRRLYAGGHFSLMEARPKTGRFHQIRRHLAHLRHPIALDSNYGTGWFNRKMRQEAGLVRLGLHALCLTFSTAAGPRRVCAPLPDDFSQALGRLGVPASAITAAG